MYHMHTRVRRMRGTCVYDCEHTCMSLGKMQICIIIKLTITIIPNNNRINILIKNIVKYANYFIIYIYI